MMDTAKNIAGRRQERARAFQLLYSLFFSPVETAKGLQERYTSSFYAAPIAGQELCFEHTLQASEEGDNISQQDESQQEAAIWNNLLHQRGDDSEEIITPVGDEPTPDGYAWEIFSGATQKQADIDASIKKFSEHWRVERIGKVELALLRLAFYELLYRDDVPPKVVINEAIELSKQFGDDNSRSFVNGILDAAVKAVEEGKLKRQNAAFWG